MLRLTVSKLAPYLSGTTVVTGTNPLKLALCVTPAAKYFSTSPSRGFEFILAEKRGEKENVGLVTMNRYDIMLQN